MKRCPKCAETKPIEEYYKGTYNSDGLSVWCRVCTKAHGKKARLAKKYDMTLQDLDYLFAEQGGVCKICERFLSIDTTGNLHPDAACIDHVEVDGRIVVRGILCRGCNMGLGCFRDDVIALQAAITYLTEKV